MRRPMPVRDDACVTDRRGKARRTCSPPSLDGTFRSRTIRSLLVLGLVAILVAPALPSLPTSVQQLSPAGSSHASTFQAPAGEGPTDETRASGGAYAFLDIFPSEEILGIDPDGTINATFLVTEMNNVAASITSYSYRVLYLDDTVLLPYSGGKVIDVSVDARGEAEVTVLGKVPDYITFDLMERGIDKLKMDVTFRGTDDNGDAFTIVVRAPLHILQRVAMLVDEDVYPLIKDGLTRYEQDVNLKNKADFIHEVDSWTSPEQVRNALKRLWTDEGITGAILWGYLPVPMWSMVHSDNSTEDFPIPIFYEDLDGSFKDLDDNGYYDKHYWGENDGPEIWVSHVMPPRTVVPSTNLDPSGQGTGGGLVANYYNLRNFGAFKLTRVDPNLDFYWQVDLPVEVTDDDFSIKWNGRIKADQSEMYTLAPQHGGRAKIWIDGNLVHDEDRQTWNKTEWLAEVYLTRGWHNIRIEYTNGNWGFDGCMRLMWTSDTILATAINEWLAKTHAYHNGELDYNERALLFMDYGYGTVCRMAQPIHNRQIEPLYGDNVVVKGLVNSTSADDYIEALEDGYELVSVWSHAGSGSHQINAPGVPPEANTSAPSWKVRGTEANVVTLIWGCHAGDYGRKGEGTSLISDNLAVNYAFATPNGLACAAATRSIGTTFKNVYWAWDNGSSLATGFLANLDEEYDRALIERTAPNLAKDMWVKDMVLMGDPFLTIDHRPWGQSVDIGDGEEFTSDVEVTLHMAAKDAKEMRFKDAGGAWTPWEAFATTKEWTIGEGLGAHRVYFQTRNDWGMARIPATDTITKVSTVLDQVSLEIDEGRQATNSQRLSLSIDVGQADTTALLMSLREAGAEWSGWTPFSPGLVWILSEGDGNRSVEVRVREDAGLMLAEAEDDILLDTRPPNSVATVTGETGICRWYISPATIKLEATDALSAVDRTEWNLDGSDWRPYGSPIVVEDDGSHVLNFRSYDALGNAEVPNRVSFDIDASAPQGLDCRLADGRAPINLPTILLELEANDPVSGLDSMRFRVDDEDWGEWMNYQRDHYLTLSNEDGEHEIWFSARDLAGNVAIAEEALTVVLDRVPPSIVLTEPADEQERVPVDQVITVQVTEGIDVTTLTDVNFLIQDARGIPVLGAFEFDEGEMTIRFTPEVDLQHHTAYSVMMRGEVTDLAGNQLNAGKGHMWTFFTDGILPEALSRVTAEPVDGSIAVSWDPVPRTYSGDLLGYNVYRMVDDGGPGRTFEFRATTTETSFTDDDVEEGVQYHYYVTALTEFGEGEMGAVASAIITPVVEEPEEPVDVPEDPEPVDDEPPAQRMEPDQMNMGSSIIFMVIAIVVGVIVAAALLVMRGNKE